MKCKICEKPIKICDNKLLYHTTECKGFTHIEGNHFEKQKDWNVNMLMKMHIAVKE